MKLGFKTGNYQIVYQEDRLLTEFLSAIKKYVSLSPYSIKHNIWYDHKNNVCFSQAQYRNTIFRKDSHFNSHGDNFYDCEFGDKFCRDIIKKWSNLEGQDFVRNKEITFGLKEDMKFNEKKSVLIICGGPSSNSVNWENLNYDQIWSCNHFYRNEKIANTKLDLVVVHAGIMGKENILEDHRFVEYIKEHNPVVSFEVEQGDPRIDKINFDRVQRFCDTYDNITYFNTRYRGVCGLGMRMVIYAICMGFKDVHFVGIDGRSKTETNGNLLHAFDGEKSIPNWYKRFGDDFQERQMIIFWEYIKELSEQYGSSFFNLGYKDENNVLSKFFQNEHPSLKKIEEALK